MVGKKTDKARPRVVAAGEVTAPETEMRWSEADLARAIDAARDAGLKSFKIEIAPDGIITIVVLEPGAGDT